MEKLKPKYNRSNAIKDVDTYSLHRNFENSTLEVYLVLFKRILLD